MSEHTPGPWEVALDNKATGCLRVLAPDGGMVAECWVNTRWDNKVSRLTSEQEANARLIAAAPSLLAALERAVQAGHFMDPSIMDQAREAIREATLDVQKAADGE